MSSWRGDASSFGIGIPHASTDPSTFDSMKKAMNFAEDEARRINANRPPVDHRTAYVNQEKAAERDIIHELIESTGLITKTRLLMDVIKQFVEMCAIPITGTSRWLSPHSTGFQLPACSGKSREPPYRPSPTMQKSPSVQLNFQAKAHSISFGLGESQRCTDTSA
jgi:hypothetical protein